MLFVPVKLTASLAYGSIEGGSGVSNRSGMLLRCLSAQLGRETDAGHRRDRVGGGVEEDAHRRSHRVAVDGRAGVGLEGRRSFPHVSVEGLNLARLQIDYRYISQQNRKMLLADAVLQDDELVSPRFLGRV